MAKAKNVSVSRKLLEHVLNDLEELHLHLSIYDSRLVSHIALCEVVGRHPWRRQIGAKLARKQLAEKKSVASKPNRK